MVEGAERWKVEGGDKLRGKVVGELKGSDHTKIRRRSEKQQRQNEARFLSVAGHDAAAPLDMRAHSVQVR